MKRFYEKKTNYYPTFINDEEDKYIKNNKKRMFCNSCINYDLDNEYYLCFKHIKKKKAKKKINNKIINVNYHKKKLIENFELYKIPTFKNYIYLLECIHKSVLHQGMNKIINKIDELRITYKGIYTDIKNFKHHCHICLQKNIHFYKRQPAKQIIMSEPKEKFVIDLTYPPIDLYKNTKYRYILNCVDHFSKFLISFLVVKKREEKFVIY